ncbi:cytochrome P450 [Aspergillus lucknowensis]|uniref:Cytochrome P450 n=1 Tax=Aspergillus lucknowensis TaxID=176173 RepID=A0ABR4M4T8_9EURO
MLTFCIAFVFFASYALLSYKSGAPPLPPGPKRLPLIGNLHQYPQNEPWKTYQNWHKLYGPIISLKLGQRILIVLGSHKVVRELLEKRGAIYSSRPQMAVAERVTKGLQTALLPFGPKWKFHRRLQTSILSRTTCQYYQHIQEFESKQLLYEMLSSNDFSGRFHRYISSIIFTLSYGKRLARGDESELHEIGELLRNITQATLPGRWLVDAFPALRFMPRSLAKWKQIGDQFHKREAELFTRSYTTALESQSWNWAKHIVQDKESKSATVEELSYIVGILYEAGGEATQAVLDAFVLASILHPEPVHRAKIELEAVVGANRLPSFEDLPRLPYVNAFLKEVLRWCPVAPGGLPHLVVCDDIYDGYRIPKGSMVVANHWSLDFDENTFPNATAFIPERWIDNPQLPLSAFGFGRRACVGKNLALDTLAIAISRIIWAYDIRPENCDDELVKDGTAKMESFGVISKPAPFKALFSVRDPVRQEVIEMEWKAVEKDTGSALDLVKASLLS